MKNFVCLDDNTTADKVDEVERRGYVAATVFLPVGASV